MGVYYEYVDLDSSEIIKLNSNEAFLNLDENIKNEIINAVNKMEFNRYPSNDLGEIRRLYADYANVSTDNIIVCNGSDEALDLIIGNIINDDKKVLTFGPDFVMYDFFTNIFKGKVIKYDISEMKFNVSEFIKLGKEENVDLIVFSNPNNPTGLAVDTSDILKIVEEFKDKTVIIDEAYYEFNGETVLPYIDKYENLIVTRTLSKAWGLAAIRMGFLISNKEKIKNLMDNKVPYTVSSFSKIAAETVLKNPKRVYEIAETTIKQRDLLYKELKSIEERADFYIKFYKSKSNYIYGKTNCKEKLFKVLEEANIFIRNYEGDSFRITVGSQKQNEKLIKMLQKLL